MINQMIHTPEGVRDIYGKELEQKNRVLGILRDSIHLYGFCDIETPTFEFSDVYSNQVGTTPEKEMYRLFDKEGNMLVIRPDFTPSVARCAAKYFVDQAMPVRLCYEGKAFNNISDLQGKLKETTQIGAEFIGDTNPVDADGEMICLVIDSLLKAGLTDFTVSVGNVEYFKGICEEAGLSENIISELREYISIKNYFGAEEYLSQNGVDAKFINALLDVQKLTNTVDVMQAKSYVSNERSINALEHLSKVFEFVDNYGLGQYVSLDLGMVSKLHYYSGVIFRAYTYGTGDAIVKGGRYNSLLEKFGKNSSAVGFVFLLDDIMSALQAQNILPVIEEKRVLVAYDPESRVRAFERIRTLRNQGIKTSAVALTTECDINTLNTESEKYGYTVVEFIN